MGDLVIPFEESQALRDSYPSEGRVTFTHDGKHVILGTSRAKEVFAKFIAGMEQ